MKRLTCNISGRVQMVMYRSFVLGNAKRLGLKGIVQNMEDGSVKVVAEGDKESLDHLLQLLNKGPRLARVESVKETWSEATGKFSEFKIVYDGRFDKVRSKVHNLLD